jgi:uncharacterized protein YjbJ (UPF0337 family)
MKEESVKEQAGEVAGQAKKKAGQAAQATKKTAQGVRRDAVESAQEFVESVQDVRGQLSQALSHQASERPYVALGAAASLGFILAGGLTIRLTSKLVGLGARLALSAAVKQLVDPPSA